MNATEAKPSQLPRSASPGLTELTPAGGVSSSDYVNRQLLAAVVDMQRALEDFTNRLTDQPPVTARSTAEMPYVSAIILRRLFYFD